MASVFGTLHSVPWIRKWGWKAWYGFLARNYPVPELTFMNYGFEGEAPAWTPPRLNPEDERDRYFIQLYDRVVRAYPLKDKEVLEVGCGRGGGASYITRYFAPKRLTAVDYARNNVEFCRRRHSAVGDRLHFEQGDAEALPFAAGSFDVVVNVESSHCYGNMPRFISEVKRVLRPGGLFLIADLREDTKVAQFHADLAGSGMAIIEEADLTAPVLRALDRHDEAKARLMDAHIPRRLHGVFSDFAGMKTGKIYREIQQGGIGYRLFALRAPT